VAVDLLSVTLDLIQDVHLLLVPEEHLYLIRHRMLEQSAKIGPTIMPETLVLPTDSNEPACCAIAGATAAMAAITGKKTITAKRVKGQETRGHGCAAAHALSLLAANSSR
jgi:hypothetical protein